MTTFITVFFGLGLGYLVTVLCALTLTFGITSAAPGFVARKGRLAKRYLALYGVVWLLCATAGGYCAAMLTGTLYPWLIEALLILMLSAVLWSNVEQKKRQAFAEQLVMTILSGLGVAAGFWLRLKG